MNKPKTNSEPTSQANEIASLWPGQSIDLLKALHVLTREGKLNQDSRRKLKQVQHLIQLITPHLNEMNSIADLGAGKSYLGFMLYDLWMRERPETRLWAVEQRKDLIDACHLVASRSKFDRITFVQEAILPASQSQALPETVDAVLALHACDTATDEAITFALRKKAKFIALVPCCQAEAARLLEGFSSREAGDLHSLWGHGIHRREFGSHLTNVIRALFLEARGYRVRVTELIGWEHSMKNELIVADRIQFSNSRAQAELDQVLKRFPLPLKLLSLCSDLQ
jgi:hypothetical protein